MTRNALFGWNALGLSLLLGLSAPAARAEEPAATRTRGERDDRHHHEDRRRPWLAALDDCGTATGAKGVEHDYGAVRSGSVVHDDGVTTRETTTTYTNGRQAGHRREVGHRHQERRRLGLPRAHAHGHEPERRDRTYETTGPRK